MTETVRLPSPERIAEYVAGAEKVLGDGLPAGHKLWQSWAFDLADNVLTLAARLAEAEKALREIHEYHCGCDTPGQLDRCVAQPVVLFARAYFAGAGGEA